ncbi:MMPL family transporter [Microbacterium sp. Sa4CUA7]|uniref:MMPL family transporter n=1 Tax=Microbacterium pullorum TaxID=2762236 RepID=A0ABR8S3U2_9MICO|nr:MMPL family transporter [Microbacterium pullorum]MBD7958141.1 MMPL family transporter [Microbacterium pullorum]
MRSFPAAVSRALVSRRGAWVALAAGLLALLGVIGALGSVTLTTENEAVPPQSESAQVAALSSQFDDGDASTLLIVASRADGKALAASDLTALTAVTEEVQGVQGATARGPHLSEDSEAAVIQLTADVPEPSARDFVEEVRSITSSHATGQLDLQVTGGPAFSTDISAAFDGADFTLLAVTVAIVAGLLIFTYRSPVLWLIPLTVVALADRAASVVTAAVGNALELQFDTGIVSVLVFGAGTNYALLLISRYREELQREEDHRVALAQAWRATVPAIVASNVTVVLALLTLTLTVIPGTRGLGISSAVGLLIALLSVLFVLPPALAVCSRGVFWPFIPRPGARATAGGAWRRIAQTVVRRPWLPLVGGLTLLTVMASGLWGASVGLGQTEKFRTASESAVGLEVFDAHFPAGQAMPFIVIADAQSTAPVSDAAGAVPGVVDVVTVGESADGSLVKLMVSGRPTAGTPEHTELVTQLREAVHAVPGADAMVGGPGTQDVDEREGNLHDFLLVVPLVLAVTLVVLIALLRSLVAPIVLLVVNALSAVAAIGAGAWLSRVVFGWEALDLQVPLLSFLFLVALGVDYTIFLVHRARVEAASVGTRAGMVNALAATGGVITSAGVVLAGVFAALGVLPLVTLGQIGLIVGVGVLVDTLVVRTLVVPALFSILGDRMWWPGHRTGDDEVTTQRGGPAHVGQPARVGRAG